MNGTDDWTDGAITCDTWSATYGIYGISDFWQEQNVSDQLICFRKFRTEKQFRDITCLKVIKPEIRKASQKPTFWWQAWP